LGWNYYNYDLRGSALASVLLIVFGLPLGYDAAMRCTIRGVVVLQFEGLTAIALVAFADTVLGLDQQTIAHDGHDRIVRLCCTGNARDPSPPVDAIDLRSGQRLADSR
jgi:hypothetical protein